MNNNTKSWMVIVGCILLVGGFFGWAASSQNKQFALEREVCTEKGYQALHSYGDVYCVKDGNIVGIVLSDDNDKLYLGLFKAQ